LKEVIRMSDNAETLREVLFGKFFTCPQCGRAITGEMKTYFTCPRCGKALCRESELGNFKGDYCVNCGYEITSAKRRALALVAKEN